MKNKVLVIAAHPDDEILGCGASMARHVAEGDDVSVLILAEGITSRQANRDVEKNANELLLLKEAARKANEKLGVRQVKLHNFPDNRMDTVPLLDVIKFVEQEISAANPNIIYTHHAFDLNVDHRRVHEAVLTAWRPIPGNPRGTLLFFEVPSSTDWNALNSSNVFVPNWYREVGAYLAAKKAALQEYRSEMRPWPHARSLEAIEHLARWRGSSVGVEAAEAFMLGRSLS